MRYLLHNLYYLIYQIINDLRMQVTKKNHSCNYFFDKIRETPLINDGVTSFGSVAI